MDLLDHPVLPRSERERLLRAAGGGDARARERLICHLLRLGWQAAKPYRHLGIEDGDLLQEAALTVTRCVDRYRPDGGASLATYITAAVRNRLHQVVSEDLSIIRVPHRAARAAHRGDPGKGELVAFARSVSSLSARAEEAESIPAPDETEREAERAEMAELVRGAVSALPGRQRLIIAAYYGLDGAGERSYTQIAGELGMSRSRVGDLGRLAHERLRVLLETHRWESACAS